MGRFVSQSNAVSTSNAPNDVNVIFDWMGPCGLEKGLKISAGHAKCKMLT